MNEVSREQAVIDRLYDRLDQLRRSTAERLAAVLRSTTGGTMQNRSERDSLATTYQAQAARLSAVESRLCFGRLDLRDGERRYVGRLGLSDDDQRQLLVDWRAPAAEPFYRATAAEPDGVLRRRHIATRGRTVTGVEDEALDLDAATGDGLVLNGEGALMAALDEHRTGRMRDIVGTIQAEQDRVIRSPMAGVLVVEGGPGTGKTAVALHRAAYLLYTYRERVRSGVLVVGPSAVFLRYIEAVLPSLGETGVVMVTPGRLLPGVDATGGEDPAAAALKGDLRMVGVVRRAVRARQRVPERARTLLVDGTRIELTPAAVLRARSVARRSPRPHNRARTTFVRELLLDLAERLATARRRAFDAEEAEDLLADLRESPDVRREVNLCWMPLTPQRLLADLWADPAALAAVAPHLTDSELALLHRERSAGWTPADVPLLDEASELLGHDDTAERAERRARAADRVSEFAYAEDVLRSIDGITPIRVDAATLASRAAHTGPTLTVAERAASDRTWTFAHVVVDEAQELSPMVWRLLARRCPTRSMTVVGDPAQTAALGGASAWADVLEPVAAGRWRVEQLTISYRTPAEIMDVAAAVLRAGGVAVDPPRAARSGSSPVAVRVPGLADPVVGGKGIAAVVAAELPGLGDGRLAVVLPRGQVDALAPVLASELPARAVASGREALDAPVAVLDVGQVKGLEFDVVVLVEPAAVLAGSPRGVNDLYVGLTRPTQRLVVVHDQPLPAGMETLASGESSAADRA